MKPSVSLRRVVPRHVWIGPSLSLLCFIHCVGAVALLPLLPSALAFLVEGELVEWGLLISSGALSAPLLLIDGSGWRSGWRFSWLASVTTGACGLIAESEWPLHTALAVLAGAQIAKLWRDRRCQT